MIPEDFSSPNLCGSVHRYLWTFENYARQWYVLFSLQSEGGPDWVRTANPGRFWRSFSFPGHQGIILHFPFNLWIFLPYSGLIHTHRNYDSLTISNAVAGSHKVCVLKIQGNGPSLILNIPKQYQSAPHLCPHSIHSEDLFWFHLTCVKPNMLSAWGITFFLLVTLFVCLFNFFFQTVVGFFFRIVT